MRSLLTNLFLVGTLGLSGCADSSNCDPRISAQKNLQIFADINNDLRKDVIYVAATKVRPSYNQVYESELRLKLADEHNNYGESSVIERFKYLPLDVKIEDVDGDGNLDILYVKPTRVRPSYNQVYESALILRRGNGDGTFQPEVVIENFDGVPVGLSNR